MILKFFVNDTDLRTFFEGCGYEVFYADSGYYTQAYHGRSEWVNTRRLVVRAGKQHIPADKLLEEAVKMRMLSTDLGGKLAVKKAIKSFNLME